MERQEMSEKTSVGKKNLKRREHFGKINIRLIFE
jgi:hypothetical protein